MRGKVQQNFQNGITSPKHVDNKTFTRIACKRFEKLWPVAAGDIDYPVFQPLGVF